MKFSIFVIALNLKKKKNNNNNNKKKQAVTLEITAFIFICMGSHEQITRSLTPGFQTAIH